MVQSDDNITELAASFGYDMDVVDQSSYQVITPLGEITKEIPNNTEFTWPN